MHTCIHARIMRYAISNGRILEEPPFVVVKHDDAICKVMLRNHVPVSGISLDSVRRVNSGLMSLSFEQNLQYHVLIPKEKWLIQLFLPYS